jgi:hypothetical protein
VTYHKFRKKVDLALQNEAHKIHSQERAQKQNLKALIDQDFHITIIMTKIIHQNKQI